ncbi:ABC transporter permease [Daejeonella lutea]|uniref:Putative ABC transport system permease protein n=1 Tax=Daejeonella lutea TaxID=572036 RepID=A0A1T5BR34_9SPHI|nr:FtsX-like permease family protein [Daejeonella lutea]SKB49559.1 putative ABC transport system permease protein [Daejeonella lutea]
MIRHLLKLVWNKKMKHLVLTVELFFAYLVMCFLFLLLSLAVTTSKQPNFNVDQVVSVYPGSSGDTARTILRSIKEVQHISNTSHRPYSNIATNDTLFYGDKFMRVYKNHADEGLTSVLKISMSSGRWFDQTDRGAAKLPVVITTVLRDQLFPKTKAEGQVLKIGTTVYKIIGVANDLNDPTGYQDRPHVFVMEPANMFLVRLTKPIDDKIYNKLKSAAGGDESEFSDNIIPISLYKAEYDSEHSRMMAGMMIMSSFLLINVVLGLFSILYQNINRRRPEIGLRRAAGATSAQIYWQIVLEVGLLATIAIIPGVIVALQFVFFEFFGKQPGYYPSIIYAAGVIYLVVMLCALYPAGLASRIQPAVALHEE